MGVREAAPSSSKAKPQKRGLLDDEDDDDLLCDVHRATEEDDSVGYIRSTENKSLKQGLLADDDDEDEAVDLIDLRSALHDNGKKGGYVVEAPAEWSSSTSSTIAAPPLFVTEPVQADPALGAEPIWALLPPQ